VNRRLQINTAFPFTISDILPHNAQKEKRDLFSACPAHAVKAESNAPGPVSAAAHSSAGGCYD
jgi:hypothetical protein